MCICFRLHVRAGPYVFYFTCRHISNQPFLCENQSRKIIFFIILKTNPKRIGRFPKRNTQTRIPKLTAFKLEEYKNPNTGAEMSTNSLRRLRPLQPLHLGERGDLGHRGFFIFRQTVVERKYIPKDCRVGFGGPMIMNGHKTKQQLCVYEAHHDT